MRAIRFLVLTIVFGGLTISGFSQTWIREKGGTYAQIGFNHISGVKKYSSSVSSIKLPYTTNDHTIHGYIDQGVAKNMSITAVIPLRLLSTTGDFLLTGTEPEKGSNFGLGNISVAGNYGIIQDKPVVVSATLGTDLKTGNFNSTNGLRTGYDGFGFYGGLNVGASAGKIFAQAVTQFKLRTNDYSNQIISNVELGTKVGRGLYVIVGHHLLLSTFNGNYNDGLTLLNGINANNTQFAAYSLKFGYETKNKLGFWLTGAGGYWGDEVLKAPALSVAISKVFSAKKETSNQ